MKQHLAASASAFRASRIHSRIGMRQAPCVLWTTSFFWFICVLLTAAQHAVLAVALPSATPLLWTVDLNRDELEEVNLSDGTKARVRLLDVEETRDPLRAAIRQARVKVEVNGQTITLNSGNYHLPVTFAGVQIDCPVTKGYRDT